MSRQPSWPTSSEPLPRRRQAELGQELLGSEPGPQPRRQCHVYPRGHPGQCWVHGQEGGCTDTPGHRAFPFLLLSLKKAVPELSEVTSVCNNIYQDFCLERLLPAPSATVSEHNSMVHVPLREQPCMQARCGPKLPASQPGCRRQPRSPNQRRRRAEPADPGALTHGAEPSPARRESRRRELRPAMGEQRPSSPGKCPVLEQHELIVQ